MGALTFKPKGLIATAPDTSSVNLDVLSTGAVILKDSVGTERSGFTTDLFLKPRGVPATVGNSGSLYGTAPGAAYKDSAGNEVPFVFTSARWAQASLVQVYLAAGQGPTPIPTGLFVDPPAGQNVEYTIGANQLFVSSALPLVPINTYGEQPLLFSPAAGTPTDRWLLQPLNAPSGTLISSAAPVFTPNEVVLEFDNTGNPDGVTLVSYFLLSAPWLLGV